MVYLSAEKFMYRFIRALREEHRRLQGAVPLSVNVLMIDDVQFISGKESTQEEFFHTFNTLVDQGRQIVLSADKSPSDLEGMEERSEVAPRLGPGRRHPCHHLRAAAGHPAGQGGAARGRDPAARWWSSWPAASLATCASWKGR